MSSPWHVQARNLKEGEKWTCLICSEIVYDVVDTPCCGNYYCRACIKNVYKDTTRDCPSCRRKLPANITTRSTPAVVRDLNSLAVWCPHHLVEQSDGKTQGCTTLLTYSDVKRHLGTSCQFHVTGCKMCKRTDIIRGQLVTHIQECPKRPIKCDLCQFNLKADEMVGHLSTNCPDTLVNCTAKDCKESVKRKDLQDHLATACAFNLKKCKYAWAGCLHTYTPITESEHLASFGDRHSQLMEKTHEDDHRRIKLLEDRLEVLEKQSGLKKKRRNSEELPTGASIKKNRPASVATDVSITEQLSLVPVRTIDSSSFAQVLCTSDNILFLCTTGHGFFVIDHKAFEDETASPFSPHRFVALCSSRTRHGPTIVALATSSKGDIVYALMQENDGLALNSICVLDTRGCIIRKTPTLRSTDGYLCNLRHIDVCRNDKFLLVWGSNTLYKFPLASSIPTATAKLDVKHPLGVQRAMNNRLMVFEPRGYRVIDEASFALISFTPWSGSEDFVKMWKLGTSKYITHDQRHVSVVTYAPSHGHPQPFVNQQLITPSLPLSFAFKSTKRLEPRRLIVICDSHVCLFVL